MFWGYAFYMDIKQETAAKLLDLVKRLNYAFYVEGTAKAMRPIMAETKALIAEAEGRQNG